MSKSSARSRIANARSIVGRNTPRSRIAWIITGVTGVVVAIGTFVLRKQRNQQGGNGTTQTSRLGTYTPKDRVAPAAKQPADGKPEASGKPASDKNTPTGDGSSDATATRETGDGTAEHAGSDDSASHNGTAMTDTRH